MEKSKQSEMQVIALIEQFNALSVKVMNLELDHHLELIALKEQVSIAEREGALEKKTVATLEAQIEEDTTLIAALKEDIRQLQNMEEADAAKLGALQEVAQRKSNEGQLEAELEASRNAWQLQFQETEKVLKQQYTQKALELQTKQQSIDEMTTKLVKLTSTLVVEKEESFITRTLMTLQTMATKITLLRKVCEQA